MLPSFETAGIALALTYWLNKYPVKKVAEDAVAKVVH